MQKDALCILREALGKHKRGFALLQPSFFTKIETLESF